MQTHTHTHILSVRYQDLLNFLHWNGLNWLQRFKSTINFKQLRNMQRNSYALSFVVGESFSVEDKQPPPPTLDLSTLLHQEALFVDKVLAQGLLNNKATQS